MLSVGYRIPKAGSNVLFSSGPVKSKVELLEAARLLKDKGFKIFATEGTSKFFTESGVENTLVAWPDSSNKPNSLDMIREKKFDLVVNIPKNLSKGELKNGYQIRRNAIDFNIPLITNARLASAFINAFCKIDITEIAIKSWEEYK